MTIEGAALLVDATTDRDAPVRECPLCPPWVECAHYGDQVVRLVTHETMRRWPNKCYANEAADIARVVPVVNGPGRLDREAGIPPSCKCWRGYEGAILPDSTSSCDTEAEARVEFDRRVALMLEVE